MRSLLFSALLLFALVAGNAEVKPPPNTGENEDSMFGGSSGEGSDTGGSQPSQATSQTSSALPPDPEENGSPDNQSSATATNSNTRIAQPDPVIQRTEQLFSQGQQEQALAYLKEEKEKQPDNLRLQEYAKLKEPKRLSQDPVAWAQNKLQGFLSNRDAGHVPEGGSYVAAAPLSVLAAKAPPQPAAQPPARITTLSPSAHRMLGMKDYSGFERQLTLDIQKDPLNPFNYRWRALGRRFLKKLREAEEDADRALAINPKDGPSYGVKALVRLDAGDAFAAKGFAEKALEINPRDADAHFTLSQALLNLGHDEAALEEMRLAAEFNEQAFGAAYRGALLEKSAPRRLLQARALYLGAAGLALLFLGMSLFARRATTLKRQASPSPMRAEDRDTLVKVGGYRIGRRLGQGGMGVVFEAIDEALERKVALKQMRSEISGDPRERRRFLKEARLVASLRHPNIVEIFSVVEQAEELFLVFEYLPGQTLDHVLRAGRLAPPQALALGRQIAAALDFAHGQGVVHQDLKPANILLSDSRLKVMDFGIARRVQESLSTLSRSEGAGTPAYMAPEQEAGGFRKESDIYALGVCLYELLSGQLPFGGSATAFVKAQRHYPLLSQAAGLPSAVDAVIARVLDPQPSERPASAHQFVDELQRCLT